MELLAHLQFGCLNSRSLKMMAKDKIIDNMKPVETIDNFKCPVCQIVKGPKVYSKIISKTKSWSKSECFHMDFAFINIKSHRGFTVYLSIRVEFKGYPLAFPTKNKRTALDLVN